MPHDLPFMQEISDAFVSNQSNQFLLTGNVLDLQSCPWESADSEQRYRTLTEYLRRRLTMKDESRLVLTYNIARGIEFASDDDRQRARELYLSLFDQDRRQEGANAFNQAVGRSSSYVLASLVILRQLCQAAAQRGISISIIMEYFDSIIPDSPVSHMGDQDRQRLIYLKEWLTEPSFVDSPHLLMLIAETASGVNESVRSLPHLVHVHVPLPDEDERKAFLRWVLHQNPDLTLKGSQISFARLSAGMTCLGIEQTMRLAKYRKGKLENDDFTFYLNRLLAASIGDHIEIIQPSHSLDDVIGATALKGHLDRLTRVLKSGKPEIAPVGILVTGPNGVGKTWIFMAWAAATGRIVIILKNLRSSFFGETDQIFEKIRNVLEVLGNVIVIVDEADTVFARPGANTHETEQRLFGNLIKMMGNPDNRAKIVWLLMTARPDNLAPDLKRSGRCGLHLPVFDPEGDDREAFIDFVLSQCGMTLAAFTGKLRQRFLEQTRAFSAADFRELVVELKSERVIRRRDLTAEDVLELLTDFLPGDIGLQRRQQTLQALLHCSRRSLIPPSLRDLDREAVQREIMQIQRTLG